MICGKSSEYEMPGSFNCRFFNFLVKPGAVANRTYRAWGAYGITEIFS